MAYKDEYEVARLLLDGATDQRIKDAFVDAKPKFNLHPPMLRARPQEKAGARQLVPPEPRHARADEGVAGVEARPVRPRRGTQGRARADRLVPRLLADIERSLTPETYDVALAVAGAPEGIRGYESIKLANVEKVRAEVEAKRAELAGAGEATPAS